MTISMTARSLGRRLLATDDGTLMRYAFLALLGAAGIFVAIDVSELRSASDTLPGADPMQQDSMPSLPPALTEGEPADPPSEVTGDPDILRHPIQFQLKSGGILEASGAIAVGSALRFKSEIEARGEYVKTVLLNSPGGSVDDALEISALIRERKLATKVAAGALCASSCPIVFAGGISREAEKGAVIGVHQVFNGGRDRPSAEQAMSSAQSMTARVTRHLDAMGIKPGVWMHALETPPDRLYYLSEAEMRELSLTTPPAATAQAN